MNNSKIFYTLFIAISVVYFFLPTHNSSLDAYAYASSVKYGELLFKPHHLLYNAFLYIIKLFVETIGFSIDVLRMSKIVNALFTLFNLLIFYKILKQLLKSDIEILTLLAIAAFSFSSLRFGTENETYILPITFSLLASLFFLYYLRKKLLYTLFLSGLFASVAALFHQIHFFWWFGLFIGLFLFVKKFKPVFTYTIPALIVPFIYSIVIVNYHNQALTYENVIHFVFYDFYTGTAKSEFGLYNIFFIIVSSIRTFFQVHPIILELIKKSYIFLIPIFVFLYFSFKVVKRILNKQLISKRLNLFSVFVKTHLIIFSLHFLFAFYAVGNVEFLVMMPYLLFLSIFYYFKINSQILIWLSVVLFVWNVSFGLFPNNKYNINNHDELIDFITENDGYFVVKEGVVINQYWYKTGVDNYKKIILINKEERVQSIIKNEAFFYTDIIDKPKVFDRAQILEKTTIDLAIYKKEKILTYNTIYGNSKLYRIQLK